LYSREFSFSLSGFAYPTSPLVGSLAVGLVAFLFTLLFTGGLYTLARERERVSDVVEARTDELLNAYRKLENKNEERNQAEAALDEERNLLKTLMDILPSRIFVKDIESRFVLANRAQAEIFGLKDPEDVYGKTTFDFKPNEGSERRLADDREVMESGKSFINREEMQIEADGSRRWSLTTKVPLRNSQKKIVGLVGTSNDITERKLASEAVEKYAEQLRKRNVQMEDDLQMAREIQQAFIPQHSPVFPRESLFPVQTVHLSHRYVPSATLAGDFFDIFSISDEKLGVFICDVMGHGVRAALFTAYLRGLIEELRPVAEDPAILMSELNKGLMAILRRTGTPMFASAFYMAVDVRKGEIEYVSAGHPAPLWLRRDKGVVEFLKPNRKMSGPALGLVENIRYTSDPFRIDANDLILLYTDGLFEVHDGDWEQYGEDRLLAAAQAQIALSSDRLFDKLLNEIEQFSATDKFPDDVCMVALDYCAERTPAMGKA